MWRRRPAGSPGGAWQRLQDSNLAEDGTVAGPPPQRQRGVAAPVCPAQQRSLFERLLAAGCTSMQRAGRKCELSQPAQPTCTAGPPQCPPAALTAHPTSRRAEKRFLPWSRRLPQTCWPGTAVGARPVRLRPAAGTARRPTALQRVRAALRPARSHAFGAPPGWGCLRCAGWEAQYFKHLGWKECRLQDGVWHPLCSSLDRQMPSRR